MYNKRRDHEYSVTSELTNTTTSTQRNSNYDRWLLYGLTAYGASLSICFYSLLGTHYRNKILWYYKAYNEESENAIAGLTT